MALIPTVIEKTMDGNERAFDIYSKLINDRIIFLHHEVETGMADTIVAQLLYLESLDPEKEITLMINSPGGSVHDGLAIIDTMNYIKCPVRTLCMGSACSMGAAILVSGEPGRRCILPSGYVMIHEVSSGQSGKISQQETNFKHSMELNELLMEKLAASTNGKMTKEEMTDLCHRDIWLNAQKALEMGLVDQIIEKR